jgi:glycosyltransferase involved in cell wall biosynthesis
MTKKRHIDPSESRIPNPESRFPPFEAVMKILYAIPSFCIGGAEKVFHDLAGGMKARGHTCGLLVTAEEWGSGAPSLPTAAFAAVHPIPRRCWTSPGHAARTIAGHYDLVHLTLLPYDYRLPLMEAGPPCVHTVHSILGWAAHYPHGFHAHERVSAMTTVERQTRSYIADINPGVRVEYIANGIDISNGGIRDPGSGIRTAESGRCNPESRIPNPGSRCPVVVMLGRISPWAKHQVMFARVAGIVQSRARKAGEAEPVFRVIGGSRPEDRPLEDRLAAAAQECGGRIEITGPLAPEAARAALAEASVFCMTSSSEGSPLALLEAMALGLPCVATAVGGVPELIPPWSERGSLVAVDDDLGMAAAVEQILRFPDLAAGLGANARAYVEKEHRVEQMVERYESLYRELVT